ncbi:MAG: hypothetical protein QW483_02150, partial [Nanopusillaceae archaeon]
MVERKNIEDYLNIDVEKELELYKYLYFSNFLKFYEFICLKIYNIFKISSGDKNKIQQFELVRRSLNLKISYNHIYTFQIFFLFLSILISFLILFIFGDLLILIILLIFSILFSYFLGEYPFLLYKSIKNKKKSQLVSFLLFLALKMRESPNLEKALLFSVRYTPPPLKIDILVLLKDIINKVYFSAADALDKYSKLWEEEAPFFSTGIQLLISSIYEPDPIERE